MLRFVLSSLSVSVLILSASQTAMAHPEFNSEAQAQSSDLSDFKMPSEADIEAIIDKMPDFNGIMNDLSKVMKDDRLRSQMETTAKSFSKSIEDSGAFNASASIIILSRVTFAAIDAAAIERHRASPLTIASALHDRLGGKRLPSIKATAALTSKASTARRISSRRLKDKALLSLRPFGIESGFKMTAAATTGPANGPRPASSTPQTGHVPFSWYCVSKLKSGRNFDIEGSYFGLNPAIGLRHCDFHNTGLFWNKKV